MHIEVGVVDAAKMVLSYGTAAASFGFLAKQAIGAAKSSGAMPLVAKSLMASVAVFLFFEVFPHYPVGVSEVHFILGSTLFLLLGLAPTSIGLSVGLLVQGVFFAPFDLPNYSVNMTTLLVPLFMMSVLAKKIIPANLAYKDLAYSQVLKLSLAYQGGIVAWVVFWALYGQGFGNENLAAVASFGAAYMLVVILEPLIDLAVLVIAKNSDKLSHTQLLESRLYHGA